MLLRERDRDLFSDRREILAALHRNAALLERGQGVNLALVGQRRVGKTMLAQRFADDLCRSGSPLVPVYFDVARNLSVPAVFAVRLMASVSRSFAQADGREAGDAGGIPDTSDLLEIARQTGEETIVATARQMSQEMEKERPDERLLIETALSCLDQIARSKNRKALVILDEFDSVTQFDNFPRIKDTLSLVGHTLDQQSGVGYMAVSSNIRMVERIVQSKASPLFDQFQVVPVPPFDETATAEFCHKNLPPHLTTDEILARLYAFTFGHPFYLNCLITAMRRLDAGGEPKPRADPNALLDRAIYEDVLMQEGQIYQYCKHRVEMTLAEARGKATLRSVLLALTEAGQANLAKIGLQLKRRPGEVRSYLQRLSEFDLIGRVGRRYTIADPVIALWIKFTILERTPAFSEYTDATRRYLDRLAGEERD